MDSCLVQAAAAAAVDVGDLAVGLVTLVAAAALVAFADLVVVDDVHPAVVVVAAAVVVDLAPDRICCLVLSQIQ